GDGARAYIDAFTDFRVAQIAEMVRLRTLAQLDFLGLDEVPQVSVFAHLASGAHMSVRPKHRSRSHARVFHDRSRLYRDAVAQDGISDHAIRADAAIRADLRMTQQLHKGLNHGVGANFHVAVNHAGVRIINRNARLQQFAALRQPQPR